MNRHNSKEAIAKRMLKDIRHGRHCTFLLHSHLVFVTDYPEIRKKLWGVALGSPSHFAGSCGCASIDVVRKYIEEQEHPR